jgi:PAS domain S-box-containing protein
MAPKAEPTADPVLAILDGLGVVVFVANPEGRLTAVRGAVTSRFGYRPEELLGKSMGVLASPESAEFFEEKLRRQLSRTAAPSVYQITMLTKTRSRVRVHVRTALLREEGKTTGIAAILHPILESESARPHRSWLTLTPRQHEILIMLAEGLSTDEIASGLTIQRDTVRNHIRSLLRALGSHSRLEAVAKARQAGLL